MKSDRELLESIAIDVAAIKATLASSAREPARASGSGPVFPPYGKSKGQPIAGASVQDLEYYASGCARTLNDPAKARWHDKERVLLSAINAELAKHGRSNAAPEPDDFGGPPVDDMPF